MCCRARTPKNFQVRANMMIKKKSVKKICCYDQKQQPPFFHICCFFVAIGCSNKKMLPECCPTKKENILFRKFFSKILSNVSSDPCHRGGGLIWIWIMYLHHILKLCLRSGQKSPKLSNKTFFLTHRKTKNPRSKKFRHVRFMETFNI